MDLPVKLPREVSLTGSGGSPLAKVESFVNVSCPKCSGSPNEKRIPWTPSLNLPGTFLRYASPKYDAAPLDREKVEYWLPIDQYIGGIEHAVGHLIYFRYFTKILRDLGIYLLMSRVRTSP